MSATTCHPLDASVPHDPYSVWCWGLIVMFVDRPLWLCSSRQQYAQALAQQKAAALSSAPIQQQQQQQQQINVLLQQYQALKLRWANPEKLHCTHTRAG